MISTDDSGRLLSALVDVARTFRIAEQRGRDAGMAGTAFALLHRLRHGESRLSELAQRVRVSAPVASRTIDFLERAGHVDRRPDPTDGRAQVFSLTDGGHAHLRDLEAKAVLRFSRALDDWSSDDVVQAVAIMQRLTDHLADALDHPESPDRLDHSEGDA